MRLLLTAATRGIGYAVAAQAQAEGADIALTGSQPDTVRRAAERIGARGAGAAVHPIVVDVADARSITEGVAEARQRLGGPIDGLFLNVPGAAAGPLDALDEGAWEHAFRLHLLSVLRVMAALRRDLSAAAPGRVVLISSYSAREAIEGLALSNVLRPAVHALVKEMARAYGPEGILVNAIAPGRIDTDRVRAVEAAQALRRGVDGATVRGEIEGAIPLGRYGTPQELARVAVFLLSRENTYVTGQNLLVDGGLVRAQ